MKHGEKITFEFVEGGACNDCIFASRGCEDSGLFGVNAVIDCTGGNFIESPTHGPHLHSRFGTDPETLKKIQHIADWYNGFDVPEYEFWDYEDVSYGVASLIGYDDGSWLSRNDNIGWVNHCKIKTFDTILGQITDEMCRIGNPMGGRLWVEVMCGLQGTLFGVIGDRAIITENNEVRTVPAVLVRLATPEELQAKNIDPREAGVKGAYTGTV